MEKLTRKYGLVTAICMVVGTVIGSGVFFKGAKVLTQTGGNMTLGILAWALTGIVMLFCALQFSVMATKYEKVSGVVDYAEATCGKRYAYYLAWFLVNIYYPAMTSVLAWVSARYFGEMVGWSNVGPEVMTLAGAFLIGVYAMNALAPKLAGIFQTSATFIKLVPIVLMAVVGSIVGLFNGTLATNVTSLLPEGDSITFGGGLFAGVVASVFAYEGWICATSINAELKDPKKNLPIALVIGSTVVIIAYVLFNIGLGGGASLGVLATDDGVYVSFRNIFGSVAGTLLNICIVVSCLGTLNGLMMAETRGMYALAVRNEGPNPKLFIQIDKETNATSNSAVYGLLITVFWLLYFYGANLTNGWFGLFNFDSSELPIITIYAMYIPMFIIWMKSEKKMGTFKRFVLPILAIISCLFMVFAAVYAHGVIPFNDAKLVGKFSFPVLFYLIVFAVIMGIGVIFDLAKKKNKTQDE
ncbi:MAG: amino acid permease [Clostridia bacterium]|nr:amino acid permease [Clostridia bacterium]